MAHRNALLTGQKRVLEMVATGAPVEDTLGELTRFIEAQQEGLRCGIVIVDADGEHFRRGIGPSLPEAYHRAFEGMPIARPDLGPCGRTAREGRPVDTPDAASDRRWPEKWRRFAISCGFASCRSAPVVAADGRVLAAFAMYYDERRDPSPVQPELIEIATHLAGIALERERGQQLLRDRERHYRELLEALPVAVYTTDAAGRITFYNEAAAELAGRRPQLNRDRWCVSWRLNSPDGRRLPHGRCPMAAALKQNRPIRGAEIVVERPDGARAPALAYPTPLHDGFGALSGAVNMLVDITERKRDEEALKRLAETLEERVVERTRQLTDEIAERRKAEAALRQSQKMEAVGQLTGGVAHDFNNILAVITGNLDLLERLAEADPAARRLVDAAQRATERGARLTQQLLAFSRRQTLHPEVVDLGRLVAEGEELLHHAVGEAVEVEIRIDPRLWSCRIDAGQFENSLLNLAVNARDAMPKGGKLTVALDNAEIDGSGGSDLPPGDYVRIAVADTGQGIAPELLDRVLEPFFTTKDSARGTGLGLSQVYGFVNQSGGHLRIHSSPGRGTTVVICLPRAPEGAVAEAWNEQDAVPPTGSERILVVEDDPGLREVTVAALRILGYQVTTARDGPEALAVLEGGEPIDLLFSDVVMPRGIDGGELARRARLLRPGIRVLLASGYPAGHRAATASDLPILNKPYRAAELAGKLRAVLASGNRKARERVPAD